MNVQDLNIWERHPGRQHNGVAVAGEGVSGGEGEIGASVSAGREYRHMGAKAVDGAVVELERHHAATAALVHDEIDHEVFDEKLARVLERRAVEGMQHGMPGAVGSGASPLGGAFSVMGGHAAEWPLVNLAFFGAP